MNALSQMITDLRAHQVISRELLALAERESQALRQAQPNALQEIHQTRKTLLPRFGGSAGVWVACMMFFHATAQFVGIARVKVAVCQTLQNVNVMELVHNISRGESARRPRA